MTQASTDCTDELTYRMSGSSFSAIAVGGRSCNSNCRQRRELGRSSTVVENSSSCCEVGYFRDKLSCDEGVGVPLEKNVLGVGGRSLHFRTRRMIRALSVNGCEDYVQQVDTLQVRGANHASHHLGRRMGTASSVRDSCPHRCPSPSCRHISGEETIAGQISKQIHEVGESISMPRFSSISLEYETRHRIERDPEPEHYRHSTGRSSSSSAMSIEGQESSIAALVTAGRRRNDIDAREIDRGSQFQQLMLLPTCNGGADSGNTSPHTPAVGRAGSSCRASKLIAPNSNTTRGAPLPFEMLAVKSDASDGLCNPIQKRDHEKKRNVYSLLPSSCDTSFRSPELPTLSLFRRRQRDEGDWGPGEENDVTVIHTDIDGCVSPRKRSRMSPSTAHQHLAPPQNPRQQNLHRMPVTLTSTSTAGGALMMQRFQHQELPQHRAGVVMTCPTSGLEQNVANVVHVAHRRASFVDPSLQQSWTSNSVSGCFGPSPDTSSSPTLQKPKPNSPCSLEGAPIASDTDEGTASPATRVERSRVPLLEASSDDPDNCECSLSSHQRHGDDEEKADPMEEGMTSAESPVDTNKMEKGEGGDDADSDGRPIHRDVGEYDYLAGQGGHGVHNLGNKRVRDMIVGLLPKYLATQSYEEKGRIVAGVVADVYAHGGAFLQRHEGGKHWVRLSDRESFKKISQRFREESCRPRRKKKEAESKKSRRSKKPDLGQSSEPRCHGTRSSSPS